MDQVDVLGPRFGKSMKDVARAIGALSTEQISELERTGVTSVEAAGGTHEIRREEVQVSHADPDGWVLERERGWSVALDLTIDDSLRAEGFAREVVNKIQFMRRKAEFSISDRIVVRLAGTDVLSRAVTAHDDMIRRETQAESIAVTGSDGSDGDAIASESEVSDEWSINGEPAVIGLTRVGSGQVLER